MSNVKQCSKCGKEHNRSHRYCAACHASNMRQWRKTHPLQGIARLKDISRSIAAVYKKRGKIIIEPCEVCGELAQMHHADYNQPLKVRWLCRPHHLELHKHD